MAERSEDEPVAVARRERGWASTMARRALRSDAAYSTLAALIFGYLRAVQATGRLVCDGKTPDQVFADHAPFIATTWHSEAFLLPLFRPRSRPVDVMVSRAADGEVMRRALERMGCGTVRGSGASNPSRMHEKGAVVALRALKSSLDGGRTVVMTADSTAVRRGTASLGLPVLARLSQRPVVPLAVVTSRYRRVGSWDRAAVPMPFSRIGFAHGAPVDVPRGADDALLEEKRLEIEQSLYVATRRAYEIVGRTGD